MDNANNILKKYLELKESNIWKYITKKNDIYMYKAILPEICEFPAYFIKAVINKPKNEIIKYMWNNNLETAKKNDPNLIMRNEIESGKNWRVLSQYNSTTWPINPRHFLFVQSRIDIGDTTYIISRSIEHKEIPYENKTCIRAFIHMSVYEYKDINGTTIINQITHIDPKGAIPVWVVELYADNFLNMFNEWKK